MPKLYDKHILQKNYGKLSHIKKLWKENHCEEKKKVNSNLWVTSAMNYSWHHFNFCFKLIALMHLIIINIDSHIFNFIDAISFNEHFCLHQCEFKHTLAQTDSWSKAIFIHLFTYLSCMAVSARLIFGSLCFRKQNTKTIPVHTLFGRCTSQQVILHFVLFPLFTVMDLDRKFVVSSKSSIIFFLF